jgi:opacity protein-like surface antigen
MNILLAGCVIWSTSVRGQEPAKTKTTTTTTVTTEQETVPDSTKPAPVEQSAPVPAAQEPSSPAPEWKGAHIGAVAQATFTDVKVTGSNGTVNTSYVVGYGAGGYLGYFFNPNVEVRVEALYSSLAQQIEYGNTERKMHLSYVNFPLLLGLHTGYNKPVSLNIVAGPQIGINTGSSIDGDGSEGVDTVQASISVKPADIGIAYGAGLDFGFGKERLVHLNIGFRGVYGLVDISDGNKSTTTSDLYIIDRAHLKTYSGYAGISVKL